MPENRPDPAKTTSGTYRGRIAPTPTGLLHLGHAATFSVAHERARASGGTLIYRTEDLDPERCKPEFAQAAIEDLRWWGLEWDEGPDSGGPFASYIQSERLSRYQSVMEILLADGRIYPSPHSRKQIAESGAVPSPVDGDYIFPDAFRGEKADQAPHPFDPSINWRLRVPDGQSVAFEDKRSGQKAFTAGKDFGDFLVWRKDGVPSYEMAVVVDDHLMKISEVVRGEDLLLSTSRQLLLYEALGWKPPAWYHCPLIDDPKTGKRMSKTHKSLSLRAIRESGKDPGLSIAEYMDFYRG